MTLKKQQIWVNINFWTVVKAAQYIIWNLDTFIKSCLPLLEIAWNRPVAGNGADKKNAKVCFYNLLKN